MDTIQRSRMLWRIPLATAILFALFWGIWYLVAGEVPTISQIKWTERTTIQIPFEISRLWDIVFAPIFAFLLVFLFTNGKIRNTEGSVYGLVFGLVCGLVCGLIFFGKFIFSRKTWAMLGRWLSGK